MKVIAPIKYEAISLFCITEFELEEVSKTEGLSIIMTNRAIFYYVY